MGVVPARGDDAAMIEIWAPGDPRTPTGGYRYNRHVAAASRGRIGVRRVDPPDLTSRMNTARSEGVDTVVLDSLYLLHPSELRKALNRVGGRGAGNGVPRIAFLIHLFPSHDRNAENRSAGEFEAEFLGRADCVIVPSRFVALSARERGARSVTIVPPGIRWTRANRISRAGNRLATRGRGTVNFVTVANFGPIKNLEWLAETVLATLDRRIRWRWYVVGDGDACSTARFRAAIREAGVAHRVTELGTMPYPAAIETIGSADIVLQPSLFESYGMAAAEAIALGVPVVTNDVGGTADVVADSVNGVLCEANDKKAWVTAIERFFLDRQYRLRLKLGARSTSFPSWSAGADAIVRTCSRRDG